MDIKLCNSLKNILYKTNIIRILFFNVILSLLYSTSLQLPLNQVCLKNI